MLDKLADRFWPGPLTIIVRAGGKLPLRSTANTGNVACACPTPPFPRGCGATRPANHGYLGQPLGASECTNAACVRDQLADRIPLIIDGGSTGRARPTTIVDLSLGSGRWVILREAPFRRMRLSWCCRDESGH